MTPTVAFHTLGCKLNYSESSTIARRFIEKGYRRVKVNRSADVYVINTCSVTENANRDCRKFVRKILKQTPNAFVIVTGCYAQLKPDEVADIPGVNAVIGTEDKPKILENISNFNIKSDVLVCHSEISDSIEFSPSFSINDRTRSFLKVQDGCDYNCTFCTIPNARGLSRNQSIIKNLQSIQKIEEYGVKEIVLTGVNIGDFGKSTGESFLNLIRELDSNSTIPRLRISSIEPNLLTDEIIQFVADSEKYLPHFHIPLQSGSDKILRKMRRRYRKSEYAGRINTIKSTIPDCAVGVDVIVGFPDETENDFMETFEFLSELDISYLHVFTYSERDNTPAAVMNHTVHREIRMERSKILRKLSKEKLSAFIKGQSGQVRNVLIESKNNGFLSGLTDNYIRIQTVGNESFLNTIQKVKITQNLGSSALGQIMN